MKEIDTSFIKDSDYLITHELGDIPGLSDFQSNQQQIELNQQEIKTEIDKKEQSEDEKIENYIRNIAQSLGFDLKKNNKENKNKKINNEENPKLIEKEKEFVKEDDIFYKTDIENNTYLTEIFTIIKKYIDGIIIILSTENYEYRENFVLITKLRKVIGRDITNSLVILNKMDLAENPGEAIEKCKGLFIKYFPKFQTFNLNLNNFIPLSINQMQNELLMEKNFKDLIFYHCYIFKSKINKIKEVKNTTFLNHLIGIVKLEDITNRELEPQLKKFNQFNQSKNISEINEEIISVIKELKKEFNDKDINFGINNNYEQDLNNNKFSEKNSIGILKILYNYQLNKKLIPPISEETINLLDFFRSNKSLKVKLTKKKVEMKERAIINK